MKTIDSIYIVRHGQTDCNKKGIIQGRSVNAPLNEQGKEQALAFYEHYYHLKFDAIFTSSLIRTHQTVAPFINSGHQHFTFDELDEIGWGVHEGKQPSVDLNLEYKRITNDWTKGKWHSKTTGGESAWEVQQRVSFFLDQLAEHNHKKILICTHGRTSRVLLCTLLQQSLNEMKHYKHHNTALSVLKKVETQKFNLTLLNCTKHLM